MGVHPGSIGKDYTTELEFAYAHKAASVAVGEIGLDFYRSTEHKAEQISALEEQIQWAREWDLPVIIHSRSAFPELLETFKKCRFPDFRGILHAWSGGLEVFQEANKYGKFYRVLEGAYFKNARLAQIVDKTDLADIVLETDAPWLAPDPFRGKETKAHTWYILSTNWRR